MAVAFRSWERISRHIRKSANFSNRPAFGAVKKLKEARWMSMIIFANWKLFLARMKIAWIEYLELSCNSIFRSVQCFRLNVKNVIKFSFNRLLRNMIRNVNLISWNAVGAYRYFLKKILINILRDANLLV